ncbi:MAG: DUF3179 domain-containing (seleno)protein [Acidimicrobiales bacterium]
MAAVAVTLTAAACTDAVADPPGGAAEAPPAFVDLSLDDKIDAFLEAPNSTLASNVAGDMGLDGDRRWGPWLLDLLRLGPSTATDDVVAGALAEISGVARPESRFITDDYRVYGQWVHNQAIEPGDGYRAWKEALYGPIDDDYAALLAAVDDDVLLGQIQWGGVPRGGIPELNDPARLPAPSADWMEPDEIVFGVTVGDEAVAYPFRILGHNELANDTVGDVPISVVFCTLCRTALVFDRRVEGQVLDFQTSGLLVNSNKIMVDVQTDTLWSHLGAVGLAGPLVGVELEQVVVETTTWAEWTAAHPDTEVLDIPDPIFYDEPERGAIAYPYKPDSPYRTYYDDPDVWFPILDTPTTDIGLKDEVLGLESGGAALAVDVAAVIDGGPRVFVVGGTPFVVVPVGSAGARVYDGIGADGLVDGAAPVLVGSDGEAAVLDDGTVLPRVAATQGLWFAWFGNHPDTDWWPRG